MPNCPRVEDSTADARAGKVSVPATNFFYLATFFLRLAGFVILAAGAAMLTLRFAVLPRLESFRPWIEQTASRALGAQVSIGALTGRWRWRALRPEIKISHLSLHDATGQMGLSVPQTIAMLSWRTVWALKPIFTTVHIDAPVMVARRNADGRIWIAGIPLDVGTQGKSAFSAALLEQRSITLRDGVVQWQDEARLAAPLALSNLQLTLSNKGRQHHLDAQAYSSNSDHGRAFEFLKLNARFQHRLFASAGDPAHWRGKFEFSVRALDLAYIGRRFNLPVQIKKGRLNARIQAQFDALSARGTVSLAATQASVTLNRVFDDPTLAFDTLKGRIHWTVERHAGAQARLRVQVPRLTFSNADAAGAVHAVYQRDAGAGLGTLDLSVTFDRLLVACIPRYLPNSMNKTVRTYLNHALKGGVARQATLDVRGDLDHFPFWYPPPSGGVFRVVAPFEGGRFDPSLHSNDGAVEGWPALKGIQGVFRMDRNRLSFDIDRARYRNVALTEIRGRIDDLSKKTDDLVIDGRAHGPLADLLHYANASPVSGWLGGLTEPLDARGQAILALRIQVPRRERAHEKIHTTGTLTFIDNTLSWDTLPSLTALNGVLNFTERHWMLQRARAHFLGGAVTGAGGSNPDGSSELVFDGVFAAAAIQNTVGSSLNTLTQRLAGTAPYRMTVSAPPHAPPRFIVTSNLNGLAIDLPMPLGKTAQASMPARAVWENARLLPKKDMENRLARPFSVRRSGLRELRLGPLVAQYPMRDRAGAITRGHIQLGVDTSIAPLRSIQGEGVSAQIQLDTVDLDAWRTVVEPLVHVAERVSQPNLLSAYWPSRIQAEIGALTLARRSWQKLTLDAARQNGGWQATLTAHERDLGQIEAALHENSNAQRSEGVPLWQLDTLRIHNPDAQLEARGYWKRATPNMQNGEAAPDKPLKNTLALDFKLKLHNAGALLTRLGLPNTVHGGGGTLTGQLDWQDKERLFEYSNLNGALTLDVQEGRILPLDPGIGRLLGLFSLQSWARFLTLNVNGAFGPGLDFDRIRATGIIRRGTVQSQDFEIESQNARITVQGTVNLSAQTQDLQVTLVPVFKADVVALAAAALNPLIGIGSYIAQWMLLPSIAHGFAHQYAVTGTWSQPSIQSIQVLQPSGQDKIGGAMQNTF